MTDREILAELKQSWEYLYDITENGSELHCNGQAKKYLIAHLEKAKNEIELVYSNFYDMLDNKDVLVEKTDDEEIFISNEVSGDYIGVCGVEEYYLTSADMNEYKWWKDEEFNYAEAKVAYENLNKVNWEVDYVLTHSAPFSIKDKLYGNNNLYAPSSTERMLEAILRNIKFKRWYFGHYHIDKNMNNFKAMYENIERMKFT